MFCDNFGDMESARNNRGTAATVPAAFELSGAAPDNTTNARREIPSRTLVRRAPHGLRYVAVDASAACWRPRDALWLRRPVGNNNRGVPTRNRKPHELQL